MQGQWKRLHRAAQPRHRSADQGSASSRLQADGHPLAHRSGPVIDEHDQRAAKRTATN